MSPKSKHGLATLEGEEEEDASDEGSSLAHGEYDCGIEESSRSGLEGLAEQDAAACEGKGREVEEGWLRSCWILIALLMEPPVGVRRSQGAGGLSAYDESKCELVAEDEGECSGRRDSSPC